MMLLTLRGTPCLYYGDELGLTAGDVPGNRIVDVAQPSRDPGRTPMPWTAEGGWHHPWLPLSDTSRNVEDQRADTESTLQFVHDLIVLRRRIGDLHRGAYVELEAPEGAWAWRRGGRMVIALNLGDREVELLDIHGAIALTTSRLHEGDLVSGRLLVPPSSGVIVEMA
jgi:alpha-glucosidase